MDIPASNDTTVVDDETGSSFYACADGRNPGAGAWGTQFVQDLPGGARDNTQMSQQEMADYINAQNDKRFLPDAQIPFDPYAEAPRTGPNVPGANELINPYSGKTARVAAKDAKKVKISEKTSGPNGEVRGNTDPYHIIRLARTLLSLALICWLMLTRRQKAASMHSRQQQVQQK